MSQVWFWLVYMPIKRCGRAAKRRAAAGGGGDGSVFGAGEEALPAPLGARPSPRLTRRFTVNTGWFGGAPLMRAHSSPTVAPIEPLEAPLPDERANERATLEGR